MKKIKKLLIVVDMQNDFLNGSLGNKDCMNVVPKVCDYIKKYDGDILVTQDTHKKNYSKTLEGQKLPTEHCIKGSKGWRVNTDVLKALKRKKYRFIEKPTFGSLKLIDILLRKQYNEITLIGVCTDICVISNAVICKTTLPDSNISVISSCCAGTSKVSHLRALEAMKVFHIDIK